MAVKKGKKTKHPGVWEQPDGRYLIEVSVTVDGRQKKRRELVEARTPEEAVVARAELKRSMAPEPRFATGATFVTGYSRAWLKGKVGDVRPQVLTKYSETLARFVLPVIGDVAVDEVARAHANAVARGLEQALAPDGAPFRQGTLTGHWGRAKNMLKDLAADFGLADPTWRVKPPKGAKGKVVGNRAGHEKRTLTAEQLQQLLSTVEERWPHRFAEVYTIAATGMRPAELFALRWRHVTAEALSIERSVAHLGGGRYFEGPTKTGDPRVVPLVDDAGEPLRLKTVLEAHRRSLGRIPGADDLVFPSDKGSYRQPPSLNYLLREAGAVAMIEVRVGARVLRRTWNTLMAGETDRLVQRDILGHTTEALTARYFNSTAEQKGAAMKTFESKVSG